jgi:uncharacterized protein YbjT (DUF2867 family)
MSDSPTVAVAGASGFVGRALVTDLLPDHRVIALGRSAAERPPEPGEPERRRCDLYSLADAEHALEGVDVGVYLVHSMMPSSRLVQGSFEDLDLILADNFGRAAATCGVARIVYLGGLLPETGELSPHLASRAEVEEALAAHGVPVTRVRAGLVIGRGGSSLEILVKLVRRLPVMLCPSWTASRTQPVALEDAVAALRFAVDEADTAGRVAEIGGPDVLTYRELMAATARALGLRRRMLSVPFMTPRLSRLWVTLFSGKSRALVEPLVESLRHEMVVDDPWLQQRMGRKGTPVVRALAASAEDAESPPPIPWRRRTVELPATARSVQRLPLPPGWNAPDVAAEYVAWLPRLLRFVLRAEREGDAARFYLPVSRRPALVLTNDRARSELTRALLDVTGGWLVRPLSGGRPRLEFRLTPDGAHVIAAVHEFHPRLPWYIYRWSQALVHLWVMRRFGAHLSRRGSASPPVPSRPDRGS